MPSNTIERARDAGAPVVPSLPEPSATADEAALLPPKLQWQLVAWYRRRGLLDDAEAALAAIEARLGRSARVLDERAAIALHQRDADAVIALHDERRSVAASPQADAAFLRALLELGELDRAAALADGFAVRAEDEPAVAGVIAELGLQMGDPSAAWERAERHLASDPANVGARLLQARIALFNGDPDGAREALDAALANAAALTGNQRHSAAAIAEFLGQPARAQALRLQASREDAARTAALAAEIDAALGRDVPGDFLADGGAHQRPGAPNGGSAGADAVTPDSRSAAVGAGPDEPAAPATVDAPDSDLVDAIRDEVPDDPRVLDALREYWGFDGLRPGQAAVINRVMAGRDTLAIMPTGAGKSLTFQLPSMLLDGITLVISPLIALMKDQVEGLPPAVRERTALLNSTLAPEEQRRLIDGIADGEYRLVYVAPERLRQHAFVRALAEGGVARVVVDEAHCISLWGHDFRPDYLSIPAALPALGNPPVAAITATATREMEGGISAGFGRPLEVVRASVFRPNLRYEVETLPDRQAKIDRIIAICREERGAGIVYVSSRRDAETIADLLRRARVQAIHYHAGMDPDTRARHQDLFMDGQARVVVATVAFGMGVDKADVRFIVHASPPGSLEAYAQESGRAGRDGLPARCVMLATTRDRTALRRIAGRDALDIDDLRRAYAAVRARARGAWAMLDPSSLSIGSPGGDPDDAPDPRIALNLLEQGRLVKRHPDAPVGYSVRPNPEKEGAGGPLWDRLAEWLGLDRTPASFRTAEACDALGCTPLELAAAIAEAPGWTGREENRIACWELLPAGHDAAARMNAVMLEAKRRAERRIASVIDYQAGLRCRHAALARHLGERLDPCETACDVCDPDPDRPNQPVARARQRTRLAADDLVAVAKGAGSLDFAVGRKRLVLMLAGSRESKFEPNATPYYGALADLQKARIEEAIDRLVEAGVLEIAPEEEYRVVRPTPEGRSFTIEEAADLLGPAAAPADRAASGSLAGRAAAADEDLDPDAAAVYEALTEWRREQAQANGLPAYTIATNASLREMAIRRPGTLDDLAAIKGFGAGRAERYAAELLAILRGE